MSARTDLCGGRSAMIVPTATSPRRLEGKLWFWAYHRRSFPYSICGRTEWVRTRISEKGKDRPQPNRNSKKGRALAYLQQSNDPRPQEIGMDTFVSSDGFCPDQSWRFAQVPISPRLM